VYQTMGPDGSVVLDRGGPNGGLGGAGGNAGLPGAGDPDGGCGRPGPSGPVGAPGNPSFLILEQRG
ncbi:MAG TPA: hypothetical protein VK196_13410, partial [Magnetospirillum sp.]|nr:hypothetical protein [Magnetospirillum sp.]